MSNQPPPRPPAVEWHTPDHDWKGDLIALAIASVVVAVISHVVVTLERTDMDQPPESKPDAFVIQQQIDQVDAVCAELAAGMKRILSEGGSVETSHSVGSCIVEDAFGTPVDVLANGRETFTIRFNGGAVDTTRRLTPESLEAIDANGSGG